MAEKSKLPVRRTLHQPASTLQPQELVTWEDMQGTEVKLNAELVKALFKSKYPLSDTECVLFLQQARSRRANPFLGQIYLVKYAADSPASIVTGYHWFMERAQANPNYEGYETWAINEEGKRIPDGMETQQGVVVIAYVCNVYHRGRRPTKFVARMSEFSKGQSMWRVEGGMRILMLEKCAIANALRRGDSGLAALLLAEEQGSDVIEGEVVRIDEPLAEAEREPEEDTPSEPEPEVNGKSALLARLRTACAAKELAPTTALKWASDTFQRDVAKFADLTEEQLTQLLAEVETPDQEAGQQTMA